MEKRFDELLQQSSSRSRLLKSAHIAIGLVFGTYSIALSIYEPQYIKVAVMLVICGVILALVGPGTELDPNEPDGGENLAKSNGFLLFIALLIAGAITILLLLSALIETTRWGLSLGFFVTAGGCLWALLQSREWSAKRFPSLWRSEYECGICESGTFRDGKYRCPVCDFASKSKKRFGLRQHIKKAHPEVLSEVDIFKKVCNDCLTRDNSESG